ncbi:NUDIX domain-containing protein [Micromonospora sp. AP08]|uniref:NUDIX domain-containing protein n=1 Tax=Micromonospora sp. AP08 TaxID=2604467 RepID=UPI002105C638|nr:NUDIX hydrolase [Micromonospora sp. AP08]
MLDNSAADDRPLYKRDPDAWQAYLAEGNAKQARKRVGADVLIRNEQGHALLVNPWYKPDWDLPVGMAEANEPPHQAAEREIREEFGLELKVNKLLVVDWIPTARSMTTASCSSLTSAPLSNSKGEPFGSGMMSCWPTSSAALKKQKMSSDPTSGAGSRTQSPQHWTGLPDI